MHGRNMGWLMAAYSAVSVSIDGFFWGGANLKTLKSHVKEQFSKQKRHRQALCFVTGPRPGGEVCCLAIYCCAAECNASSKGSKSSGRLLGFCENYGNAGEMDEQHFITINQSPLINKVHFLFPMIQGIIKRTLSLSFWLTNPSLHWRRTRWRETLFFRP